MNYCNSCERGPCFGNSMTDGRMIVKNGRSVLETSSIKDCPHRVKLREEKNEVQNTVIERLIRREG